MSPFSYIVTLVAIAMYAIIATTNARSFSPEVEHVSSPRVKRSTDSCTVHPNTPVILNGKETFFDFDANEPAPASQPGDLETLSCPNKTGSWWPGVTPNHRASCPWRLTPIDTWLAAAPDTYPRYVVDAACLCHRCVNAKDMRCIGLKRQMQIYHKIGCDGNKPVFEAHKFAITIGCYCAQ